MQICTNFIVILENDHLSIRKRCAIYLSYGISWHIPAENLTDSLKDKLTNI